MGENEIGGIRRFDGFGEAPSGHAEPPPPRAVEPRPPATDRVELTAPEVAALRVFRERLHAHTQEQLQLAELPVTLSVYEGPALAGDAFVGRVLAEQAQLAAPRRGAWSVPRIEAALREAMWLAAGETLEILDELDQLDVATWRVVGEVLAAWGAKLERAAHR